MAPVFLYYDELPSTHDHAISMLSKTTPQEATVIVAANQSAGIGRHDRKWTSAANENMLLSCILYPKHLRSTNVFHLNIMATLATHQLLVNLKIEDISIKWPNDVLVGKQKIAGILIQNQLTGQSISSSVISIGLNVNQEIWADNTIRATSIKNHVSQPKDINPLVKSWIDHLLTCYQKSKSAKGLDDLKVLWQRRLEGFGKEALYENRDGTTFQAKLIDVKEDGQLVLQTEKALVNSTKAYHMDEVRFRAIIN